MSPTSLPFPAPTDAQQYADDLDVFLGAPQPVAPATEAVTQAWVESESPTFPGWNGLGTELGLPGATPDPSNPRVFDYKSLTDGLTAAKDMMLGEGPQTTALAPKFVSDVRSGKASPATLVADVQSSLWAGKAPDTYDATAIAAKLRGTQFAVTAPEVASAAGHPSSPGGTTPIGATPAGFNWNPLTWPGQVLGSATSSLAGTIGTYILKGVLTLVGGSMIVYGATLLADKKGSTPAVAPAPAESLEEPFEEFPFVAAA